jgi:hypothetical protein
VKVFAFTTSTCIDARSIPANIIFFFFSFFIQFSECRTLHKAGSQDTYQSAQSTICSAKRVLTRKRRPRTETWCEY